MLFVLTPHRLRRETREPSLIPSPPTLTGKLASTPTDIIIAAISISVSLMPTAQNNRALL